MRRLLATGLLALALAGPALAAYPGENGVIAFATVTGSTVSEIAVVAPDGSFVIERTALGVRTSSPAWSPSGKKLAFFAVSATNTILYTMDADGENLTPVLTTGTGNASNSGPSWSPDGTKLAAALGGGIYAIDVATRASTPLATNPSSTHYFDQPAWSPNGAQIAVRIHHQGVGVYNFQDDIGVLPATGGSVTNLTENRNPDGAVGDAGCLVSSPAWAPDSSKIVYSYGSCQRPEEAFPGSGPEARTNVRLATVTPSGGALTLLTPLLLADRRRLANPAYSPDATQIVAEFADPQANLFALAILPAGGLPPQLPGIVILEDVLASAPDWQPIVPTRNAIDLRFDPVRVDQFGLEHFEAQPHGFWRSSAFAKLVDQEAKPIPATEVEFEPNVFVDPRLTENPRNVLCDVQGGRLWPKSFGDGSLDYLTSPTLVTGPDGVARADVLAGTQAGGEWLLEAREIASTSVTDAEFLRSTGTPQGAVDGIGLLDALQAQLAAPRFTLSPVGTPSEKQDVLLEWLGLLRWTAFGDATFDQRFQVEFAPIHSGNGARAAIVFYPALSTPNPLLNYMLSGPAAGDPRAWFVLDTELLQGAALDNYTPRIVVTNAVALPTLAEWEQQIGSFAVPGRLVPQLDETLTYFGYPYPPPAALAAAATLRATFARCISVPGLVTAEVHSPVNVLFTDAQGRKFGADASAIHFEAPGVLVETSGPNPGGYALPPGPYRVTLTGTDKGLATVIFTVPTASGVQTSVFDLKAKPGTTGELAVGPDGAAQSFKFGRKRYRAKAGLGLRIDGLPKKVKRDTPVSLDVTLTNQLGNAVAGAHLEVTGEGLTAQATTDAAGKATIQFQAPAKPRKKKLTVTASADGHEPATATIKVKR